MRILIAAALALAAMAGPAGAQWIAQRDDDPFAGGKTALAMAMNGSGYVFGFRCTSAGELAVIYATGEAATADTIKAFAVIKPQIMLIVDDGSRKAIDAEADLVDGKVRLFSTADGVDAWAREVAASKRRVAVAIDFLGKVWHSTQFGVAGSGRAIRQMADACDLDLSPS